MKTYYLMSIAGFLARFVPHRVAYWLCSLAGGLIFVISAGVREAVLDNLRHVLPKASVRARRKLGRQTVRNVIKNYYDVLRLPGMSIRDLEKSVTIYGLEYIDEALAKGRGVILTGGHIGNFAIVAQMAAARGYTMSIIAEDIEPPQLYDYINHLRSRFGLRMIKLGSAEVRTIYRLLRNNEGLMLAADRDVNNDGVPTIFFDALAAMPPGPVALALRLGTPFLPVYTYRKPDNTSVAYVSPPMEMTHTGDRDLDLKINMRKIAQVLEEQILKNPSQWVVLQKIWDNEYTGIEESAAQESSAAPSTNGTAPQLENANPPELQAAKRA